MRKHINLSDAKKEYDGIYWVQMENVEYEMKVNHHLNDLVVHIAKAHLKSFGFYGMTHDGMKKLFILGDRYQQ